MNKFFPTKTLKENGLALPVGVVAGERFDKTLEVIPYKLKQERELAKIKRPGLPVSEYVQTALSLLVARFGPHDFTKMEPGERKLVISQAWLPDILYTYLYVRYNSLGADYPIEAKCGSCGTLNKYIVGDLSTVEVAIVNDPKAMYWDVELRDGLPIMGKNRSRLRLQPPVYGMLDFNAAVEGELPFLNVLRACLVTAEGVEGPPVILDADADEMSKWDIESVQRTIEERTPGPRMIVESRCRRCKSEMLSVINWASEGFFSLPSRPSMKSS